MRFRSLLHGRKRYIAATALAVALGSGAYAFAASLTVTTNTLGSGAASVTNNCSLSTSYSTTYQANGGSPRYVLSTVTVTPSGSNCNSAFYKVDVADSSGNSLEEWTGQFASTAVAVNLTASSTIDAASIGNVAAVVESGNQP